MKISIKSIISSIIALFTAASVLFMPYLYCYEMNFSAWELIHYGKMSGMCEFGVKLMVIAIIGVIISALCGKKAIAILSSLTGLTTAGYSIVGRTYFQHVGVGQKIVLFCFLALFVISVINIPAIEKPIKRGAIK